MMKYKGYIGHVTYDDDAKIITFQGMAVDELEKAFRESVDDYLVWCKERGEKPEKTFSGTFNLRIPPDLHAQLALQAKAVGTSLNSYITQTLQQATGKGR